jgi:hypothetical protein
MGAKNLTETGVIPVSLVVFTCEGREHLLLKSFESFSGACEDDFAYKILVIDGKINQVAIDLVSPDMIIQSTLRRGYVNSIITALKNIETDYFFWLEDDFLFNQKVPLDYMLNTMVKDKSWAGIFLSRTAPLTITEKKIHLFDNLYVPDFGFSVSPTLCKTEHIKNAFTAMIAHTQDESTKYISFEPFIDEFFIQNELKYAIIDPGSISHIKHFGDLESTAREYHMINSISIPIKPVHKEYISGLQRTTTINLYNKAGMFIKLYISVFYLSIKLFFERESYDFAFRIYRAFLKRFKH